MKEMLIENKDFVLRAYSFFVFFLPWLIAMYWNIKLMSGIREKMGPKFWVTIFPNKEANNIISNDARLSFYKQRVNFLFPVILIVWLVGFAVLVLLIAWLNDKL